MKIPVDPAARHSFYIDLISKCNATRDSRREFYKQMRSYYLFGCEDRALSESLRYNKIFPHIDTVASFMFSPETTRFTLNLGASVNAGEQAKVAPLTQRMHSVWHGADIDQQFRQSVRWSAAYGKMHLKFRPKVHKKLNENKEIDKQLQVQAFIVEPHNFGVLREDKDGLYRQEAFCETFHLSHGQLRNELTASGKSVKEVDEIMVSVQGGHREDVLADATPIDRLIVTAIQGDSVSGNAAMFAMPLSTLYRPTTKEDLIELQELYVYDDAVNDYRVVTYASPQIAVFDRPLELMFLPGILPYVEVCLNPTYDYYWGHSEVEKLVPLQDLRNERMKDIVHILRKQAHPPTSITGETAIPDEMRLALDTPSGILSIGSPAAAINSIKQELPGDLWHDITVIDSMFDELSGLPAVNQGRGTSGVRSEGHAQLLSQLGSTRVRDRSLVVEDSLDDCAWLITEILKRYDSRPMRMDEGPEFFAAQFTDDYEAKVDGHSNSPVFVENHEQKAFALFDRKAIDREELLDLVEIPMRPALKKKLREKIEPAEAKEAEQQHQEKIASIEAKRSRGVA